MPRAHQGILIGLVLQDVQCDLDLTKEKVEKEKEKQQQGGG